ncbi:HupE/UreJ family protein [Alteromonas sp. AMM-1]|uniref:HupE/UreJ family protein n=1 Tax=Alteromonas sp. AMM-1 TaxID=3394233 RepID=UPI0039A65C86
MLTLRAFLLFLSVTWALSAHAHPASQSQIEISRDYQQVTFLLSLPLDQLAVALPSASRWQFAKEPNIAVLNRYLNQHMSLLQSDHPLEIRFGQSWLSEENSEFVVKVPATAFFKASQEQTLQLTYDVIQHKVINHQTVVTMANDIYQGTLVDGPALLGVLRYKHNHVAIAAVTPELPVMMSLFTHGMAHIVTGSDHLAFLLCLLLVNGLTIRHRKWHQHRASVTDSIKLVSAFTLGHTITLLANLLLPVPVISNWIEVAVAVTVLVSAIHVMVPVFTRQPYWIAAGFGLIHGMAFSSAINVTGLSASTTALAAMSFNLGIECVQIGLVCLLVPCINLWRQTRMYTTLRMTLASLVVALSVVWVIQRMSPFMANVDTSLTATVLTQLLGIGLLGTALLYACHPKRKHQCVSHTYH